MRARIILADCYTSNGFDLIAKSSIVSRMSGQLGDIESRPLATRRVIGLDCGWQHRVAVFRSFICRYGCHLVSTCPSAPLRMQKLTTTGGGACKTAYTRVVALDAACRLLS